MTEISEENTFRGFPTRREVWQIAGRRFELIWPADIDALLDLPITAQRFERDEYMPYWAQPWPSAILLARHILEDEEGAGRSAIEIGCGIGLVSVAAAGRGWQTTTTDYDADAVAFARENARLNCTTLHECRTLDYRQPLPSPVYSRIFGADLLYERRKAEPVLRWLTSALEPGGEALICDPNRSAADEFPGLAERAGLIVETIPLEMPHPASQSIIKGRIWRLSSPS